MWKGNRSNRRLEDAVPARHLQRLDRQHQPSDHLASMSLTVLRPRSIGDRIPDDRKSHNNPLSLRPAHLEFRNAYVHIALRSIYAMNSRAR